MLYQANFVVLVSSHHKACEVAYFSACRKGIRYVLPTMSAAAAKLLLKRKLTNGQLETYVKYYLYKTRKHD